MTKDQLIALANKAGMIGPKSAKQGFVIYATPQSLERLYLLIKSAIDAARGEKHE